ncbi:hypothetical protein B0H16DRAFT_1741797 [Mycena metata]|uniref:Uncharacterized protein n=1 Tax=Mycena metata TaxID=1033252 RepID=A0AAD7MFR0_9AGAR|nr:hypothetical protein B0H16DRAFT_1741797 [Mycena metata]
MAPPKQIAERRTNAGSPTPDSPEPLLQDMRPPGAPTTQTAPDSRPRPSLNDLATQHELFGHTKRLHSTLHEKLNIPHCIEAFQCETCGAYFKHLQEARLDDGRRSGLKLRSKQNQHESNDESDDDDGDEDDEDEGEGEDEDEEPELMNPEDESLMDPLFRLQDLRGKMRAMAWFNSGAERSQDAGGFAALSMQLATVEQKKEDTISQNAELQTELQAVKEHADKTCADLRMRLAEIEKGRGDVLCQNAELQAQLQVIKQNADNTCTDLRIRFESALSDAANARADLSLARADGDQARTDRDHAQQELSSAQQKITSLSQELANIDSARPRKRSHAPYIIASNIPTATHGIPPPLTRTAEEQQWEALHRMQRPQPADHPLTIAHFLQHNEETTFKGIPTSGPKWVIDMRDVRGYREVASRVPVKPRTEATQARFYRFRCLTRVLEVLAVPGKYSNLLSESNKQVGPVVSLTPCVFGEKPESLSDADVAVLLAEKGLTVSSADDSWQFCYKYLAAHAAQPDSTTTAQMLDLWSRISTAFPPPGLNSSDADQYLKSFASERTVGGVAEQDVNIDRHSFPANSRSATFRSPARAGVVEVYHVFPRPFETRAHGALPLSEAFAESNFDILFIKLLDLNQCDVRRAWDLPTPPSTIYTRRTRTPLSFLGVGAAWGTHRTFPTTSSTVELRERELRRPSSPMDLKWHDVGYPRDLPHHVLDSLSSANANSAALLGLNGRDVEHPQDIPHHVLDSLSSANGKSAVSMDLKWDDMGHPQDLPHHVLDSLSSANTYPTVVPLPGLNSRDVEHPQDLPHHVLDSLSPANANSAVIASRQFEHNDGVCRHWEQLPQGKDIRGLFFSLAIQ